MSIRIVVFAVLIMSLGRVAAEARELNAGYRIGVLTELSQKSVENWRAVLARHGFVEGEKTTFIVRAADGDFELLPRLARELVEQQVDIILTLSTPPAIAAKKATTTIPIVTMSADPIGAGLVKSLARPGANVTGLFLPLADLASKRLQLLKEIVPELSSVAILWNPNNPPARLQMEATQAAASSLGIRSYVVEIRSQDDLKSGLQKITARHPGGLMIMQDPLLSSLSRELAEFAIQNRLPTSHAYRPFVEAGGLMCYGFSIPGMWEAGAEYADKILKGARPAELPMEQPTRVEVVINLRTAKALRLQIPESILLRVDEVIR
jgi:ABC-type uncharacterized transport system substrate-binding protein